MAPRANGASAATLSFDPSSVNTSVDSTFDLDIIVKVGTSEVLGVDALVEFDSDKFVRKIFYQQEISNHAFSITINKSLAYEIISA